MSTSLVTVKTKVAPIKRVTVPHLELRGAVLLAMLLHHVAKVLEVPGENIYAWTNGIMVLSWLRGNPWQFKTTVENQVSEIIHVVFCNRW